MHADDRYDVDQRRQRKMTQVLFQFGRASSFGAEAQGQHAAALAEPLGEFHPADAARGVAEEGRRHLLRPRRRVVEPVEIILPDQHFGRVRLIEREKFRLAVFCAVAPSAAEAWNADALRHVLAIVPLVELGAPLGGDSIPDRDHRLACKAHFSCPSILACASPGTP